MTSSFSKNIHSIKGYQQSIGIESNEKETIQTLLITLNLTR